MTHGVPKYGHKFAESLTKSTHTCCGRRGRGVGIEIAKIFFITKGCEYCTVFTENMEV